MSFFTMLPGSKPISCSTTIILRTMSDTQYIFVERVNMHVRTRMAVFIFSLESNLPPYYKGESCSFNEFIIKIMEQLKEQGER